MTALRTRIVTLASAATIAVTGFIAAASTAQASPPACGNGSLAVTHTQANGATGHAAFVLLFRNITHSACTVTGYPGLDALNSSGHAMAHAARTLNGFAGGAGHVGVVTVPAWGWASATVEWMNFNPVTSGPCAFSASVAATPANTTHTVRFPIPVSTCSLQVHPTIAGTSGNDPFAHAQAEWLAGAQQPAATEGANWAAAVKYLKTAGSIYSTQIAQLRQLIALPNTDQTPAQNAAYHRDINALDAFFGTAHLYG